MSEELCLKCGSQITHVPYRFDGKVFHARCLLCNACGESQDYSSAPRVFAIYILMYKGS